MQNEILSDDPFTRLLHQRGFTIFLVVATVLIIGTPTGMLGVQLGPKWQMFHGYQKEYCAARFFDESGERIDRYEVTGLKRHEVRGTFLSPQSDDELKRAARTICEKSEIETLTILQSCGSEEGWVKKKPLVRKCARRGKNR